MSDVRDIAHVWEPQSTEAYGGSDAFGEPRWVKKRFYRCSNCYKGSVIKSNFCPNCGSKAREVLSHE